MKLRFRGGCFEVVRQKDPKNPRKTIETKREQFTQICEETEYHFPKKGAVLTVPTNIGGWLMYKADARAKVDGHQGQYLEQIIDEEATEQNAPRRLVAVVEEEVKPAAQPDPKPESKPVANAR